MLHASGREADELLRILAVLRGGTDTAAFPGTLLVMTARGRADGDAASWYRLRGSGAERHRWFAPQIEGGPDLGPYGNALRELGPAGLDVRVRFAQVDDHRGTELTDMLWDWSASGVKVVSHRLARALRELDPSLREQPIDVRDRSGEPIEGYTVLLEQTRATSPVHSMKHGVRGSAFVVSGAVSERLRHEGFKGLKLVRVDSGSPYPGDEPLPPLLPF